MIVNNRNSGVYLLTEIIKVLNEKTTKMTFIQYQVESKLMVQKIKHNLNTKNKKINEPVELLLIENLLLFSQKLYITCIKS